MKHKTSTLTFILICVLLFSVQWSLCFAGISPCEDQSTTDNAASSNGQDQPVVTSTETNQLQNLHPQQETIEARLNELEARQAALEEQSQVFTTTLATSIQTKCTNMVAETLALSQAEYDARYTELCSAHDGCCGKALWWACFFLIVALFIFFVLGHTKKCQCQDVGRSIELLMLLAVLLLISFGAYKLTARIVDAGTKCHLEEIAQAPNKPSAVLCAYKQLSDEMERWFALFAVLGAFFGLVVPVGTYFLQVKRVDQHEKEMKQSINAAVTCARETSAQVQEEVKGARERLEKLEQDRKGVEASFVSMNAKMQENALSLDATTSKVQKISSSIDMKISKLWRQLGNIAQIMTKDLAYGIVLEPSNPKNTIFLYWSMIWNQCARYSNNIKSNTRNTRELFATFKYLHEDLSEEQWDSFVHEVKKINENGVKFIIFENILTETEVNQFRDWLKAFEIQLDIKKLDSCKDGTCS